VRRLSEISPEVSVVQILGGLVPPPQFSDSSFANYLPDPAQPTQSAARDALVAFSDRINAGRPRRSKGLFGRGQPPESRPGVYLDGGFGVGKTHLLTALWHATESSAKSFGTFVEYTNIIGLLGFRQAVEIFSANTLVCIDEFELDDPGDTVLMSTFLRDLVAAGVFLAATSNTLPDRLGEERFAAEDFVREIQGLASHFDTIRIEGPDYRHRDLTFNSEPFTEATVHSFIGSQLSSGAVIVEWQELLSQLSSLHPAKYGALVENISVLGLVETRSLRDQVHALRFVTFVDRLYDRSVPVINSGVRLDQIFSQEMLAGGYRKKYFRCLSRLAALAESGAKMVEYENGN
jgi:cell division protein ZapE